jgi:hypothetical protein
MKEGAKYRRMSKTFATLANQWTTRVHRWHDIVENALKVEHLPVSDSHYW